MTLDIERQEARSPMVQSITLDGPATQVSPELTRRRPQETRPPALDTPAESRRPAPQLNPRIRLDPALGIAVLEVRNATGTVTLSIPGERELEAYHRQAPPLVTPPALAPTAKPPEADSGGEETTAPTKAPAGDAPAPQQTAEKAPAPAPGGRLALDL